MRKKFWLFEVRDTGFVFVVSTVNFPRDLIDKTVSKYSLSDRYQVKGPFYFEDLPESA